MSCAALWGSRVGASPADAADAKSLLQEWAQGQGLDLPAYVEVDRQGPDHAPRFTSEVRIKGRKPARGEGASKRAAEQAAATRAAGARGRVEARRRCLRQKPTTETRCGFIAVIGAPNAGKSTLVNALVGAKVAIVSRKVQTTRTPLRGIAIEGASQLVFIDTPGIFRAAPPPRPGDGGCGLGRGAATPTRCCWWSMRPRASTRTSSASSAGSKGTASAAAGAQQDRSREEGASCWSWRPSSMRRVPFAATFMISALNGDGVADLKAHLARSVAPGPWHYPEDEISDAPLRVLAAEVTREKIYDRLHDELPYQAAVETTGWQEQKNGIRIEQTIIVERDSQKRIVLGKGGSMIKQLSTEARKELTADPGAAGAPIPVREGARELGRRPRALSRPGARRFRRSDGSVSALFDTYHRLANNSTQTTADADLQTKTGMVCGRGARQAGGGFSPLAAAKAFLGPLPPAESGIEFTTNIRPSSASAYLGGPCYWHAGVTGVQSQVGDTLACIPVTVTKVM